MNFSFAPTLAATALAVLFAGGAHAIQITVEDPLVTETQVAGAITEDFENFGDATCGAYADGGCSGNFQVVTGSVGGQYAQPANTSSLYLSIPEDGTSGSASFKLGTTANYFGLYWGSIDSYNSIAFLLDNDIVESFGGDAIAEEVPGIANGNQTADSTNRYFNFFFGNLLFDEVKLTSTRRALETDNHAFATVPEPGTVALLGLGLTGLVIARRRKHV